MAQPSSSHHHRERSERSHHHRHRSISSTTLLLVLSLILAVLAVMLSLPSQQAQPKITPTSPAPSPPEPSPDSEGLWGYITPKRSQILAQRERDVAQREAEVARREAEILVGAPGGVIQTQSCPVCTTTTVIDVPPPPIQTVIKEVVKEAELTPPGWWDNARVRAEDIFDRELKIAEREREISRREESVNRREHDASRRENWVMEQLVALGNDGQVVEEEYIYDLPGPKRRPKFDELPLSPLVVTEVETEYATRTITQTQHHTIIPSVVVEGTGQPANTRRAAVPTPVPVSASVSGFVPRTTSVEVILEEVVSPPVVPIVEEFEEELELPRRRRVVSHRPPQRWWG